MPERTTWLFEGQELQSGTNGILVSSVNNLGELLFPFDIDSSFAGNYEFTMESAAGDLSATVPVMVISKSVAVWSIHVPVSLVCISEAGHVLGAMA